jgi:tRNA A37 N6-isopentenylltransferase MiaA
LRLADPANPRRVLSALEGLVHQSAGTENLEACLGPVPANARAELSKLDSIRLEVMSSKPDTDRLPRQMSCLLDTNVESMEYIPHKKYSLEDMSSAHGQLRTSGPWACGGLYVLDPGKDELAARIARRVRGMFAGGLLQEAAELRRAGQGEAEVVCEGIGYREALAVLDGTLAEEDAVERTIVRTRQYAKRQRTYFRGRGWPVFTGPELDAALQQ